MNFETLMGMKFVVDENCDSVPNFPPNKRVCEILGPERAAEYLQWCKDFFGTKDMVYVMPNRVTGEKQFVMGPTTYRKMRAQMMPTGQNIKGLFENVYLDPGAQA
jgi:hypothetical protein